MEKNDPAQAALTDAQADARAQMEEFAALVSASVSTVERAAFEARRSREAELAALPQTTREEQLERTASAIAIVRAAGGKSAGNELVIAMHDLRALRALGLGLRDRSAPLYMRFNRKKKRFEFCRNEARFDGRGAGRRMPAPLPVELAGAKLLSASRLTLQRLVGRAMGSSMTAAKGASRRVAIQDFAILVGWPATGASKETVRHFAPIGGAAPKHLRCSKRTVDSALGDLRRSRQ